METLDELFQLAGLEFGEPLPLKPSYNIAPSQAVAAIRPSAESGKPELAVLRWGLIPAWADDPKIAYKLINARSETVAQKPSFRAAFKQRRCLILADGYFEWQKIDGGKQPYYIHQPEAKPFAFAGLWEHWPGTDESKPIESCTIITTAANESIRKIHDRMPVILRPEKFGLWLDKKVQDAPVLGPLFEPSQAPRLEATAISTRVNNPRNNDPSCIAPIEAGKR